MAVQTCHEHVFINHAVTNHLLQLHAAGVTVPLQMPVPVERLAEPCRLAYTRIVRGCIKHTAHAR